MRIDSVNETDALPAVPGRDVTGLIERVITAVPAPRSHPVARPDREAARIAREAAQKAALVSGPLRASAAAAGWKARAPGFRRCLGRGG